MLTVTGRGHHTIIKPRERLWSGFVSNMNYWNRRQAVTERETLQHLIIPELTLADTQSHFKCMALDLTSSQGSAALQWCWSCSQRQLLFNTSSRGGVRGCM